MRNYREGEKSKISNWIPNIHPCVNWIDGDSHAREIVENSLLLAAISYLRGVERWLNLVRSTVQSYTRGWASEAVKMITNRRMHSWTPCVVPNTPLFPMRIVLHPSNQNGRSRQIRIFKRTRLDFIFIYTYIFFFSISSTNHSWVIRVTQAKKIDIPRWFQGQKVHSSEESRNFDVRNRVKIPGLIVYI